MKRRDSVCVKERKSERERENIKFLFCRVSLSPISLKTCVLYVLLFYVKLCVEEWTEHVCICI